MSSDYIGIDQGPILTMIANYRNEFVWNVMKKSPYIRKGLERAGFKGGWLAPAGEVSETLQSDPRAAAAREIGVSESRAAAAAADAQQQAAPPRNQPQ